MIYTQLNLYVLTWWPIVKVMGAGQPCNRMSRVEPAPTPRSRGLTRSQREIPGSSPFKGNRTQEQHTAGNRPGLGTTRIENQKAPGDRTHLTSRTTKLVPPAGPDVGPNPRRSPLVTEYHPGRAMQVLREVTVVGASIYEDEAVAQAEVVEVSSAGTSRAVMQAGALPLPVWTRFAPSLRFHRQG